VDYTFNEYVEGIRRAIEDECNTSAFYRRLAAMVPGTLCGDIFARAAADEYRHAQMLAALLSHPTPYRTAEASSAAMAICPEDIMRAIDGEFGAICEYAELAAMAPTPRARSVLLSILGDEYGHVRMFILLQETGLCGK
jgi:rubrerythrin